MFTKIYNILKVFLKNKKPEVNKKYPLKNSLTTSELDEEKIKTINDIN